MHPAGEALDGPGREPCPAAGRRRACGLPANPRDPATLPASTASAGFPRGAIADRAAASRARRREGTNLSDGGHLPEGYRGGA
jgi:hypothetical protein